MSKTLNLIIVVLKCTISNLVLFLFFVDLLLEGFLNNVDKYYKIATF